MPQQLLINKTTTNAYIEAIFLNKYQSPVKIRRAV